jgi:ATP-dependent 26S proteasome regulatory subunit
MSDTISTIIIDDFDISIAAQKENTERTSNSDILNSLFMHLCDNPNEINGKTGIKATPIIMTGNNFSNIYKPLIRNGRADLFNWIPSIHEKKHIVQKILSHIKITEREVDIIFDKYKEKNIAFFSQIKSHLIDDSIISTFDRINKYGIPSKSLLNSEFRDEAINSIKNASVDKVIQICESLDISTSDYMGG